VVLYTIMETFDAGSGELDIASRNLWEDLQEAQVKRAGERGVTRKDFLDMSPWEREIEITDEWEARQADVVRTADRNEFWKGIGKSALISIGRTYTMFSPYGIVGAYFQQRRDR